MPFGRLMKTLHGFSALIIVAESSSVVCIVSIGNNKIATNAKAVVAFDIEACCFLANMLLV